VITLLPAEDEAPYADVTRVSANPEDALQ